MFFLRLYLRAKKICFEQDIHIAKWFCGKHVDFIRTLAFLVELDWLFFPDYRKKATIMIEVSFGLGGWEGHFLRNKFKVIVLRQKLLNNQAVFIFQDAAGTIADLCFWVFVDDFCGLLE